MSEPLRHIVLELLSDGSLVVFHGRERTIFKQPIEAAIFVQLLINQLQAQAGASQHEQAHASPQADDHAG